MQTIIQPSIDQILGHANTRYFGEVFRSFSLNLLSLETSKDEIRGEIQTEYVGPSRPRDEEPHLGSIEFLALGLRLATLGLNRLVKIGISDTDRAFTRHYSIALGSSLSTGTHFYSCRLMRSTLDPQSLQGSTSLMEIKIGHIRMQIVVDHRGGARYSRLPMAETILLDTEQLHSTGYKCTNLQFGTLDMDLNKHSIATEVEYQYLFEENILHGIGSARNALLATDATRVFGQLMQVLLYNIEKTDRNQCQNIWLRKMELTMDRPLFTGKADAKIVFDRIRQIVKGDQKWMLVNLHGKVGNYVGCFEVAHLM